MSRSQSATANIFLAFTFFCGLIIFWPYHNYIPAIAQGDHGSNLYAYQQTAHGFLPFRDFWYPYGPFMPYFYASFFKIFGESIQSILLAQISLNIVSGIFFYLILQFYTKPQLAFIGALFFWGFNPGLPYTFNHSAITPLILVVLYCLFSYLKMANTWNFILSLLCITCICLIRPNIGIVVLFGNFSARLFIDYKYHQTSLKPKLITYVLSALGIVLLTVLIYTFYFQNLTIEQIKECLGYFHNDHYQTNVFKHILVYVKDIFSLTTKNIFFLSISFIFLGSFLFFLLTLFIKKDTLLLKEKNTIGIVLCFFFIILLSHEYIISGLQYRTAWIIPFNILLIFLILNVALKRIPKAFSILISIYIMLFPVWKIYRQYILLNEKKTPEHYLTHTKANIFVGNPTDWVKTVNQTSHYLEKHLQKDELFLALPYDSLYYFLAEQKNPIYRLMFFKANMISTEEELSIIQALETKNVDYIILSNRYISFEPGLGILGKTHCPILLKYILSKFKVEKTFGDFEKPAWWIDNHAVKILKRR